MGAQSKEYVHIDTIKIPDNYKIPKRMYIEQAKSKIITGAPVYVTVGMDDYIIKGYSAYMAYKELGQVGVYIIRVKDHVIDLHCDICGRVCYTTTDIDKLSTKDKEEVERLGLKYVECQAASKNSGLQDRFTSKLHTCELCARLKGNLTYRKEVRLAIITELQLRGFI